MWNTELVTNKYWSGLTYPLGGTNWLVLKYAKHCFETGLTMYVVLEGQDLISVETRLAWDSWDLPTFTSDCCVLRCTTTPRTNQFLWTVLGVLLYSPGWSPTSAFQVLGFQMCITIPGRWVVFDPFVLLVFFFLSPLHSNLSCLSFSPSFTTWATHLFLLLKRSVMPPIGTNSELRAFWVWP